ncbi:hypothetical protein ON010_g8665 [Phytophthora cinnamomi]|nr:hypothetical protein ON010_g8665 [Phytophthora cinnamomi]
MASDDDDAVFRVAAEERDRTKIEGRRRVNVASSDSTGRTAPKPRSVVATALEVTMSAYRTRPAYEILEGFQPTMKVAELAASFSHSSDPTILLQRISESSTAEVGPTNSSTNDPFAPNSLLPAISHPPTHKLKGEDHSSNKPHYRRLHFRGAFANYPSLRHCIDRFPLSPRDVALHWSEASPLALPASFRVQTLAGTSIDAVSQLSSSSEAGKYLSALAQRVAKSDKRTLYEFTRSGMSPDAPEELEAALAAMGDAYL